MVSKRAERALTFIDDALDDIDDIVPVATKISEGKPPTYTGPLDWEEVLKRALQYCRRHNMTPVIF